jgi:predicted MFS family arabinose efflux permease
MHHAGTRDWFSLSVPCLLIDCSVADCAPAGGFIGDTFGIQMPFQVAFCSFLLASIYARLALPYISPESMNGDAKNSNGRSVSGIFTPLRILVPQRLQLAGGKVVKHYGVLLLCLGVFLGVVSAITDSNRLLFTEPG